MDRRHIKIETGTASLWLQDIEGRGILDPIANRYEPCSADELQTMMNVLRKAGYIISEIGGRD